MELADLLHRELPHSELHITKLPHTTQKVTEGTPKELNAPTSKQTQMLRHVTQNKIKNPHLRSREHARYLQIHQVRMKKLSSLRG